MIWARNAWQRDGYERGPKMTSPTNKKQKNSKISGKIFRLLKISQIFQNFDPIKNSEKKSADILPASINKNLS
jgi:hypothetical protein